MLKHLPKSKILQVFKGFHNLDFFLRFFIAKFRGLKDFILRFTQGVSVVGEDGGFGYGDGGNRDFLSIEDPLRMGGAGVWLGLVGSSTVSSVMSNLSTLETTAFSHALCSFLWGEFL